MKKLFLSGIYYILLQLLFRTIIDWPEYAVFLIATRVTGNINFYSRYWHNMKSFRFFISYTKYLNSFMTTVYMIYDKNNKKYALFVATYLLNGDFI
jgi:hypothetical protein